MVNIPEKFDPQKENILDYQFENYVYFLELKSNGVKIRVIKEANIRSNNCLGIEFIFKANFIAE